MELILGLSIAIIAIILIGIEIYGQQEIESIDNPELQSLHKIYLFVLRYNRGQSIPVSEESLRNFCRFQRIHNFDNYLRKLIKTDCLLISPIVKDHVKYYIANKEKTPYKVLLQYYDNETQHKI